MDDPRGGVFAADEKSTLLAFLDFHRDALLRKVSGVGDADLGRSFVGSGTCLLGLVKHLAYVEHWWFWQVFAGRKGELPWPGDDPDFDLHLQLEDTPERILRLYRDEVGRSRRIIDTADIDDRGSPDVKTHDGPASDLSMRWIIVHMIEEAARHNGHADILRELIDGQTGE